MFPSWCWNQQQWVETNSNEFTTGSDDNSSSEDSKFLCTSEICFRMMNMILETSRINTTLLKKTHLIWSSELFTKILRPDRTNTTHKAAMVKLQRTTLSIITVFLRLKIPPAYVLKNRYFRLTWSKLRRRVFSNAFKYVAGYLQLQMQSTPSDTNLTCVLEGQRLQKWFFLRIGSYHTGLFNVMAERRNIFRTNDILDQYMALIEFFSPEITSLFQETYFCVLSFRFQPVWAYRN